MASFLKPVLYADKFLARTLDGKRAELSVTKERIQHWVDNFRSMKQAGIEIPTPWEHDPAAGPAQDKKTRVKDNAGWVADLWAAQDSKGRDALFAEMDIPNDSDAEKIGTTVREVSPLVLQKFTDGKGNVWEDVIGHLALVTHPVVPGQENFETAPPESIAAGLYCSLSTVYDPNVPKLDSDVEELAETDTKSPNDMSAVLAALTEFGLELPKDTTLENLQERIVIAALAVNSAKKHEQQEQDDTQNEDDDENEKDSTNTPPSGAEEKPSPIAMSLESNPVLRYATEQARQSLQARVEALVNTGRTTPAYAKNTLAPLLQNYVLSLDESGTPLAAEADRLLAALEALPENLAPSGKQLTTGKQGAVSLPLYSKGFKLSLETTDEDFDSDGRNPSLAEIDAEIDKQFENTGRTQYVRKQRVVAD